MTSTILGDIIIRVTINPDDELSERRAWKPGDTLQRKLRSLYKCFPRDVNLITTLVEAGLCDSVAVASMVVHALFDAMDQGTYSEVLENLSAANASDEGLRSGLDPQQVATQQMLSEITVSETASPFSHQSPTLATQFFDQFRT